MTLDVGSVELDQFRVLSYVTAHTGQAHLRA